MALMPSLTISAVLKDSYLKAYDNTRRISRKLHTTVAKIFHSNHFALTFPNQPKIFLVYFSASVSYFLASLASKIQNDFFLSGLYNLKGKPHDLGADFGLTSDVYTKPNPYYLKNKSQTEEKKPEPVYYPVYNHSVTQDGSASSSTSGDSYEVAPTSYEAKIHTYSAPSSSYGSPSYNVQSAPSSSYGVPSSSYSAPSSSYGTPSSSYGAPSSSYGSPGSSSYYPQPTYGSPQSSYGAPSYYPSTHTVISHPEPEPETQKGSHSHWFIAKILKKFDLILMSKILLKIIIFKKIVKFIGLICLLMFIPILKKKFEEHSGELDEEEERRIKSLDAYGN
jgi:hypothetical protein